MVLRWYQVPIEIEVGSVVENEIYMHIKGEREIRWYSNTLKCDHLIISIRNIIHSSIHSIRLYKRSIYLLVSNSDSEDKDNVWMALQAYSSGFFYFVLLGINFQCQVSIPTINNKIRDEDISDVHTYGGFAVRFYCSFHITLCWRGKKWCFIGKFCICKRLKELKSVRMHLN